MKMKIFLLIFFTGLFLAPLFVFNQLKTGIMFRNGDLSIKLSCDPKSISPVSLKDTTSMLVTNASNHKLENLNVVLFLVVNQKINASLITDFSPVNPDLFLLFEKAIRIGPNQSVSVAPRPTNPIPSAISCGDYALLAVVDPDNKFHELNERNNKDACPYRLMAHIDSIHHWTSPESMGGYLFESVRICGTRFGSQETRVVKVEDSTLGVYPPSNWTNTEIKGDVNPYIGAGYLKFCMELNGKKISNVVDHLIKAWIHRLDPASGSPGAVISVIGRNFGHTQGAKKIKFGSTEVGIVSWEPSKVRVTVPSLPPGSYVVKLEENGLVYDSSHSFQVI